MTTENEHPAKEQPYPIDEPTASRRIAEAAVADTVTGAMGDDIELTITPAEPRAGISQEQYLELLEAYARRLIRAEISGLEQVLGRCHGDSIEVRTVLAADLPEELDRIYGIEWEFMGDAPDVTFDFRVVTRDVEGLDSLLDPLNQYTIIDARGTDAHTGSASETGGA